MSYLYNGINISNLVDNTGSSAPPVYQGFPTSTLPTYNTSGLDKPANFSYSDTNNPYPSTPGISNQQDVSNYAKAYTYAYTSGTGTVNTFIGGGTSGPKFKYISAYCYGGGGGGGGGGGNINAYGGGNGGDGGYGGFAAIVSYPISGLSVNYQVGSGGAGGSLGNNNSSGKDGDGGSQSYVEVGSTKIIIAHGGKGGDGGKTGGATNKGSPADSGSNGNSNYVSGPGAGKAGTTANNSPASSYPNNPSNNGGGGGNGDWDNDSNSGSPGSNGYVQVYLSY